MGQEITVTTRPGASPAVRMFTCNRSITGMAIERYASPDEAGGARPPDVLARRLFDAGAWRVTIYSSAVTVERTSCSVSVKRSWASSRSTRNRNAASRWRAAASWSNNVDPNAAIPIAMTCTTAPPAARIGSVIEIGAYAKDDAP